jgi:hypothetical protein
MANANVILGADYQSIAQAYGTLLSRLNGVSTYLYEAVDTIVYMNTVDPTIDLLSSFYNTYLINASNVNGVQPYLAAVKALNNHIISRGGYTDINAYLQDVSATQNNNHPLTVPQSWSDLSSVAGQPINSTYVVADPT